MLLKNALSKFYCYSLLNINSWLRDLPAGLVWTSHLLTESAWFVFNRDASGVTGCEFTVNLIDTGYSAVEPVINWLSTTPYQINKIEANDSKFPVLFRLLVLLLEIPEKRKKFRRKSFLDC